jgi:hypothetical protein
MIELGPEATNPFLFADAPEAIPSSIASERITIPNAVILHRRRTTFALGATFYRRTRVGRLKIVGRE